MATWTNTILSWFDRVTAKVRTRSTLLRYLSAEQVNEICSNWDKPQVLEKREICFVLIELNLTDSDALES